METLWFAISAVMFAVYVVMDGFDFGAGALHLAVARSDRERRQVLAAIGPYWDGNEVWLLAVDMLKKHVNSDCVLVNTLSSAETGTVSLYFLDMKSVLNSDRVPVGYPVEGVEILILDDAELPLGIDEVGEVAVRSSFLSGGYWQKPDATSQKFIPQAEDGSSFMYLTGDLGSLSPDGCLRLLGRKDFQVKIRSFRVDVTEVETVLNQHDEIHSAAVTGRDDQIGNKRLSLLEMKVICSGPPRKGSRG